ncbi:MAG: tetratricopeptide repeat protein [Bryobacteraceae bacterium]|nr:tetratricopeptide repeat protein [Bryobacteraceae bacterium]
MPATQMSALVKLRPQPVGIYQLPAAFLLLPETDNRAALAALLMGDSHCSLPREFRFYRLALDGRAEEAYEAITGSGEIDHWNRFVLRPDANTYQDLRLRIAPDMRGMLDAAAFAVGLAEEPPTGDGLDGELLALVLATAASKFLESEDQEQAAALLARAFSEAESASPLLAAQILNQIGSLERSTHPQTAIERYRRAIALAGSTPLTSLRAELWMNLGIAWQLAAEGRRGPLLEAAKAFQESIRCGLSLDHMPEMYATAQMNLALSYLGTPAREASDQLRMGIAVQCLREALKVFRRDTHPEMWASAQMNLANALQYLPSSHPEENLQQAVNLYEELLEVRNRALDPLGYARTLANQGNALAHLGMFEPATTKLNEAHKLFHWHGEPDMAASVLELVGDINSKIEERRE